MGKIINKNDLISPEYCAINKIIYSTSSRAAGGAKYAGIVMPHVLENNYKSILDYGCGQGQFKQALDALGYDIQVNEYDPAIDGKDTMPEPADLVICCDVLEHVEPDKIDTVLKHIFSLAKKEIYLEIALCETKVFLPDGRNAHILLLTAGEWLVKISQYNPNITHFEVVLKKQQQKELILWLKS